MNCAVHTDTPAVAYCRTCGKALCEDCKRDVMGAIYCEPCIAARLQGGVATAAAAPPPVITVPSAPSPGVAMLLGFIPGVGAMYNGQFMKAFVHVLLFALFIVVASTVNQTAVEVLFGLLIGFSPIYMAFDAYKTAEAKRLGLPLPDPLGLDRLFGFQEGQSSAPPSATATSATTATANAPGSSPSSSVAGFAPAASDPGGAPPAPNRDAVPIGAVVLIGLGVLFLLGNFTRFEIGRFWPLILLGVGAWIGYRRLTVIPRGVPGTNGYIHNRTCQCARCRARGLMGSAVLITLGVLFLINEFTRFNFGEVLPALLIVIGVMLFLGRSASTDGHLQPYRAVAPYAPVATAPPVGAVPPPNPAVGGQQSSETNPPEVNR